MAPFKSPSNYLVRCSRNYWVIRTPLAVAQVKNYWCKPWLLVLLLKSQSRHWGPLELSVRPTCKRLLINWIFTYKFQHIGCPWCEDNGYTLLRVHLRWREQRLLKVGSCGRLSCPRLPQTPTDPRGGSMLQSLQRYSILSESQYILTVSTWNFQEDYWWNCELKGLNWSMNKIYFQLTSVVMVSMRVIPTPNVEMGFSTTAANANRASVVMVSIAKVTFFSLPRVWFRLFAIKKDETL